MTRKRILRALEVLAWTAFFLLAALILTLRYWVLPNIERYRGDIVSAVSRGIGQPVKVGAIEADWRGFRPQIELSDVRIQDAEGREALVLPTVSAIVSWRSLLLFDLRMHSFSIEGPRLAIRRDTQGAIHVAGVKLSQEKGDGRLTDWLLDQREILIRDAEIEWTDEMRGAPPLGLASLQFRLHNSGNEHDIGISARPPGHLGSGLEIRARLIGHSVTKPSAWNGRVFAELGYTDLAGWRQWVDYPADVRKGQGALRLWMTLGDGRLTRATADVALTDVVARLGVDLPLLEVKSVRGRVHGRETRRGYEFGARNLALVAQNGPEMHSTSFVALVEGTSPRREGTQLAEGWRPESGQVNASLIELAPLAHLADFLPFPADLRKVLADLGPRGTVQDVRFEWTGELPDKAKFKARAKFAGLGMNAWRRLPGFTGLSGQVDATELKGTLQLASQHAELDLPRVFPEPRIALDSLAGQLDWERDGEGHASVRVSNLAFANQHAAATAFGTYAFTGEGPGVIDLSAQILRADGKYTAKYLPLTTIMGERTRQWVSSAIVAGQSTDARLRLKGDLRDFPFAGGTKGQFQVAAKISKGVLDYAEGWPRIEDIEGELLFENEKMEVAGRSGRILAAKIANVRVTLPSLTGQDKVLRIAGGAEGGTDAFLKFIAQSPVRRYIDGVTDQMSATGSGKLALKLELPLADLSKNRVHGEFRFSGGSVNVDSRIPAIERAAGVIAFTESSLDIREASGQLFGGPVAINGGTQKEGGILVSARGTFTPDGMRALFDHPWRRHVTGASSYTATVGTRGGRLSATFDSPLTGIAIALPAPLEKAAAESMPLHLEIIPSESGTRERISVTLARSLHGEFLRAKEGGEMKLQRAAVALNPSSGEPIRLPERRSSLVYGTLPGLDLDRWRPLLSGDSGGGAASFDLRLGTLDAFGKRLRTVALKGGADATGWSANVNAAELAGDISYHADGDGKLTARLAYFTIPDDVPGAKASAAQTAKDFPAVDLIAESFTFRKKKLGRVEIAAAHHGANWRIDKLSMVNPDSAMSGSGMWEPANPAQPGSVSRTSLSFDLSSTDVGKFLERMGNPDHIRSGKGNLAGKVAWNGDPVNVDYASLSGDVALKMESGQFLEIEPGIGKLVSLMSLQMLPRRIALDFDDVFSKGFRFDNISASFKVTKGIMNTRDFRMRGPAAEVEIQGDVDLARETQKLFVKVIPQLGDTASTVVGLLNPVAGVATLLAGRLMKNPLGQLFAFHYGITGAWADPKVEKISASQVVQPTPAPEQPQGAAPPAPTAKSD